MRPSTAELIDLLDRALPGVVALPDGYLSESALAEVLGVDRRWLRALRAAGIVEPPGFGRGFLYSQAETRICAVVHRLADLGFPFVEIAGFFADPCDPDICRAEDRACTPHDCCERLLAGRARRLSADIDELQHLQKVLTTPPGTPSVEAPST